MAKKAKFTPIIISSREAMITAVNDCVRDKIEYASTQLAMENEIAAIQKRYQGHLDDLGRNIGAAEAGIQIWAQKNRDNTEQFPKDKKSIDLQLAVIGFRDTPYRVEKARSSDTWDDVALRMASYQETAGEGDEKKVTFDGMDYVTFSDPELSKKLLLQDRTSIPASALKAVGIRFEFDENFYIEPKSEVLDPTVKKEAA